MSDSGVDEKPPLFFAGSDEEDEDVVMEALDDVGPSSSRASSRASSRLFLDDSGDEKMAVEAETTAAGPQKRPIFVDDSDDSDTEQKVPPQTPLKRERVSDRVKSRAIA
ncbi:hypothetical protein MSAN_02243500 [Mycena sanguinolenta]|uniref:Uncharacterized protein n=1 Tax=Mycena sanguinolenta TaxID=230812 RepID=A0A8H6XC00_9AGAR|nr:hypothetical protein MSAN_02243500 [Mycena sanguinolenta]